MTVAQCNGARFSLSCRFKCVPARPSSVIVHSSSPGPPRVAEKAAAFPEIVEYNGQKPVARLGKDGSVEEASADAIGESNQQLSNTPIIRRAQEAASGALHIQLYIAGYLFLHALWQLLLCGGAVCDGYQTVTPARY